MNVFSLLKSEPTAPTLEERALGAYLGFAVGDALGAPVEFMTPNEIKGTYNGIHNSMTGGGWLRLKPGQVTDDTQMSLALGGAMLANDGWNLRAVADAFVAWLRGRPIDVGNTCRRGIRRYLQTGTLCGTPAEEDGGNGALMRNLPVALGTPPPLGDGTDAVFAQRSIEQARITHGHVFSDEATVALGRMTRVLLAGGGRGDCRKIADALVARHRTFAFDPWPGRTSGYVVDTVQTVLDVFFRGESFEACLLDVVNRGGDADTNGALTGQLAGALWGVRAIPARWLRKLDKQVSAAVEAQVHGLLRLGHWTDGTDGTDAGQGIKTGEHAHGNASEQ
ncbi:MAG: ADP-ribosyl-[dinitrogen reductase] hydrolase [Puniceicoccales bacterium]|nr:ADP-ribosyl-[dinitrogen reductase] hydrolase [Puniceicoccales bacterium]